MAGDVVPLLECISIMHKNLASIPRIKLNLYSDACLWSNAREIETGESELQGFQFEDCLAYMSPWLKK